MRFLVLLIFIETAPVAIGLVAPYGIHSIPLKQANCTGINHVCTIILHQLVLCIRDIEGHLIVEITDAIVPLHLELPSPGFQLTDIDIRNTNTDGMRQLQFRQHIVVVLPIVVERSVQTAIQQTEVDTHISGLDGFPSLIL